MLRAAAQMHTMGAEPKHDAETFTQLFEQCHQRLFIYISMLVPNLVDARDILQDTNLVLWQKFDEFELGTNFLAWAREVARYRVLRFQQVNSRNVVPIEAGLLEAAIVQKSLGHRMESESESRRVNLERCLKTLNAEDRDLISEEIYAGGLRSPNRETGWSK